MGLIRLFLAVVVAIDHWRLYNIAPRGLLMEDGWKLGFNSGYAVMFFYVISGFLITYALKHKYRDATGAFYRGRAIRIFALYWPMVALALLVVPGSWTAFAASSGGDKAAAIMLIGLDAWVAFSTYPSLAWGAPIKGLSQAWTLGAELAFYLFAPFLMRSWKIGGAVLLASLAIRTACVVYADSDSQERWIYLFLPATLCFFMLGHLAALTGDALRSPVLGLALTAGAVLAMTYGGSYAGFDTPRFWGAVVLFSVALPGLFEATKDIRWMNALGDLSYPLYLVHGIVMMQIPEWLIEASLPKSLSSNAAAYLSCVSATLLSVLAAALVHRLVELPVGKLMRRASGK
jgi:peptidoglycan/LPS O-acetylase OafA/YrhL